MAGGENMTRGTIADVSWRDLLAQDPYYWLSNSFQYSENLNCDDELHWIKLSQKAESWSQCANCQLVMAGDHVFALPLAWGTIKYFNKNNWTSPTSTAGTIGRWTYAGWVVFQDYLWYGWYDKWQSISWLNRINITGAGSPEHFVPRDHNGYGDEDIEDYRTSITWQMTWWLSCILNFNNTRLVCGSGKELRAYYPELDRYLRHETKQYGPEAWQPVQPGETGWKKVQEFEDWCTIIGLTCTFEYLKVWVQDEWWNTKVYFYPGNDDLRNVFTYNITDLTNTKVLRVYSINSIDYFTASLDGTDWYITFNKLVGNTPIQIFKQRWWLSEYDVNQKAWYFIWPTSIDAAYLDGAFYVADSYGVFKFLFNPQGNDKWYLKWKLRSSNQNCPWLAICENFLYVSDQNWLKRMRLYDTWVDWYQSQWLLISREMEWDYWWCISKMLEEVRLHFELNPLISSSQNAGDIDIYVSPNNTRRHVNPEIDDTWWYHVMHIDGSSSSQNRKTRWERTNVLNNLNDWNPAFSFDWETITYCVVINRWSSSAEWTPIVREVKLSYKLKGKTNNIYWIK